MFRPIGPRIEIARGADWSVMVSRGAAGIFAQHPTNLRVAAALAERGYDLRLVLGDGGHNPNHGGAILPDALRWLWRRESE